MTASLLEFFLNDFTTHDTLENGCRGHGSRREWLMACLWLIHVMNTFSDTLPFHNDWN